MNEISRCGDMKPSLRLQRDFCWGQTSSPHFFVKQVGARAGRLSRVLRFLRFLPFLAGGDKQDENQWGAPANGRSRRWVGMKWSWFVMLIQEITRICNYKILIISHYVISQNIRYIPIDSPTWVSSKMQLQHISDFRADGGCPVPRMVTFQRLMSQKPQGHL